MSKPPPMPDFVKILNALKKTLKIPEAAGSAALITTFSGIIGYGLYQSVYFIPGGFLGVKFNAMTGLNNTVYTEGANFAIPYVETPIMFEIRNRPFEVSSASGSKDLQIIKMAVRILYAPDPTKLPNIYRNLGLGYADTVLTSVTNEVIRSVIAQYNANELLVKRSEVSKRISDVLKQRSATHGIEISDVSITQMAFGKEYTAAVEAKQVAQQMAERGKFLVDQAYQEKRGVIVLAEGEAKSAELIGSAIKDNPSFLELRKVEAAKHIAKTLGAPTTNGTYYLDSNSLLLNINAKTA